MFISFLLSITQEPLVRFDVSKIFGKFRSLAPTLPILDYTQPWCHRLTHIERIRNETELG